MRPLPHHCVQVMRSMRGESNMTGWPVEGASTHLRYSAGSSLTTWAVVRSGPAWSLYKRMHEDCPRERGMTAAPITAAMVAWCSPRRSPAVCSAPGAAAACPRPPGPAAARQWLEGLRPPAGPHSSCGCTGAQKGFSSYHLRLGHAPHAAALANTGGRRQGASSPKRDLTAPAAQQRPWSAGARQCPCRGRPR